MRLFVAVEIPAAVRAAVAEAVAPLREAAPRLRWVAPERYHLTVVFLGSVDGGLLGAVGDAIAAGCAGVGVFPLALSGEVGTFGRRVLWAGLEPSEELAGLAGSVAAAVGPVVALPDGDRPFSAHLTLARAGREPVRRSLVASVEMPALSWSVRRVVLMQSAAGYSVVRAVDLPAANA